LVSIAIGSGTSSDDFSAIDWSAGPYFIKTAIDPSGGSSYTITGTSQLMSVPFAMYAKTSGIATLGPQGETGAAGADGTNGSNGAKGEKGDARDQGIQGETGTAGADGTNGEKGATEPIYEVNTFYAELGGFVFEISSNGKPNGADFTLL
jgi:hypothetical protein